MSSETPPRAANLAVVVHAVHDLRVETVPLADPAPDEVVLRVAFGGVCGSDLHYVSHGAAGQSVLREPMVLGHEVVGTVEVAAADGSGPAVGTPVAVHPGTPHPGDGTRYPADRPNLAPGSTYLGSAAHLPHTQGAFAQRVVLPARMLRALPEGLPLRRAALAEPAAVAWHAVQRAGDVAGRAVAVVGAGPIGALAVAVLVRAGAATVTVVDVLEQPLARATELGATATIQAGTPGAAEAIDALAADVVVEASGSAAGLDSAVRAAVRGGRVVLLGLLPPGPQPVAISPAIARELELHGSFRFADEIDDVLVALADGSLAVDPVISHVRHVRDAVDAFALAADPSRSGKVLLDFG